MTLSTWLLAGLGAAAAFWAILGISYLIARPRKKREDPGIPAGLEAVPVVRKGEGILHPEESSFEDPSMEIAMVTMALREPVIVNQTDDGGYEAFTPDGKRARGRTPGEAARGLLN